MLKRNKRISMIAAMVVGVIFILAILLALILSGVTQLKQTELTFSTGSMEAIYDGTPLTNHTWHLVSGKIKNGHHLSVSITGERTDVGESQNTIEVQITDDAGADVTGDYRIHYKLGTLKVNPRFITVTSEPAEKIHDGSPLQNPKYTITSDYSRALVLDHVAQVDIVGRITDVGETPNEVHAVKIYNGANVDVSRNYQITIREGTLRVLVDVVDLLVETESKEAVYDGTVLTVPAWNILSGALKAGHQATTVFTGQQTNVGQSPNTMVLTIIDENGENVSNEYNITYKFGTLSVTPRIITITSLPAEKKYDGQPLKQNRHNITSKYPSALAQDHFANITITGSITQVGETSNTIHSVIIYDRNAVDVTNNYQITLKEGTLRVTMNETDLVFSTASQEKIYDGSPLINHNWSLDLGTLKEGHKIDISFEGSQTSVGESENRITATIVDITGKDVTDEYQIFYNFGTLAVDPRPITITSQDAEKPYDGTPLQNQEYALSEFPLVDGHTLNAQITGTITDVGKAFNEVDTVTIYDKNGTDVSRNYQITIREGTLCVTPNDQNGGGAGAGAPSGSLGGGSDYSEIPVLNIKSTHSTPVYLKQTSFGSFLGSSWAQAYPYDALLNDTYGYQHLIGAVMQQNGVPQGEVEIEFLEPLYMLPYYLTMENGSYDLQTNDVWYSGSCDSIATLPYYIYNGYGTDLVPISGEYAAQEAAYRAFVYEQYLEIDDQTRAYMERLIAEQHFDVNDPRIISKVAVYIQHAATYNLEYDTAMDHEANVVIAFLEKYKEGVCRHYASAATLLFRALGIPARYTVGFSGETKAGEWVTISTPGHAWTEVYLDGIGWVAVEVTGGGSVEGGGGGSESKVYEISPVTVRKKYDGTPLYPLLELKGLDSLLKKGYYYDVVISGMQEKIGISQSRIEEFTLYDPNGVDVTDSFHFIFHTGKIHVYHTELYFQNNDVDKVYDAIPLAPGVLAEGSLLSGHRMSVVSTTPLSVGKHANTFSVVVYDQSGADVTYYYYIRKEFAVANISPIHLVVKAADAQKKYDGTPLTCPEASIIEGSLLEGHRIDTLVVTGSQTAVGRSENVVSEIKIIDADGNDVTENYMIEFQVGKLRVTFS